MRTDGITWGWSWTNACCIQGMLSSTTAPSVRWSQTSSGGSTSSVSAAPLEMWWLTWTTGSIIFPLKVRWFRATYTAAFCMRSCYALAKCFVLLVSYLNLNICPPAIASILFETRLGCLEQEIPTGTQDFIAAISQMFSNNLQVFLMPRWSRGLLPYWRRYKAGWDGIFTFGGCYFYC